MNEWKDLKIDNLPADILTGDYEFNYGDKYSGPEGNFELCVTSNRKRRFSIFESYLNKSESSYVRYRKPEPLPSTHEQIMTKWWKSGSSWQKVIGIFNNQYTMIRLSPELMMGIKVVEMQWFTGRESAVIPPEAE